MEASNRNKRVWEGLKVLGFKGLTKSFISPKNPLFKKWINMKKTTYFSSMENICQELHSFMDTTIFHIFPNNSQSKDVGVGPTSDTTH
jgi:hypothetical protein